MLAGPPTGNRADDPPDPSRSVSLAGARDSQIEVMTMKHYETMHDYASRLIATMTPDEIADLARCAIIETLNTYSESQLNREIARFEARAND